MTVRTKFKFWLGPFYIAYYRHKSGISRPSRVLTVRKIGGRSWRFARSDYQRARWSVEQDSPIISPREPVDNTLSIAMKRADAAGLS